MKIKNVKTTIALAACRSIIVFCFIIVPNRGYSENCNSDLQLIESGKLSGYLIFASINNPGLQTAFERWREAIQRYHQAGYLPDPVFNYRPFIRDIETRVGPIRQEFGIEQTIPWPAKLIIEKSMASEAAKAAQFDYFEERNFLFYQVKTSYYEYYFLEKAIKITLSNRLLVEHFKNIVDTRQKVGGSLADSVKITVEWILVDDKLQKFIDRRPSLIADLNALFNRKPEEYLPPPKTLDDEDFLPDEDFLRDRLTSCNPQLLALRRKTSEEKKSVTLARKNRLPNFKVGVDYIDVGPSNVPDSGKDALAARIGITIPIWQGLYNAQICEAQHRVNRTISATIDLNNRLLSQLESGFFDLTDADRRIALYRDTLLPELLLLLDTTQRAYEVGQEDLLTLIDVERQLLGIELALERALTDRAKANAFIQWLVGHHSSWLPNTGEMCG